MPGMSGLEAAEVLRNIEGQPFRGAMVLQTAFVSDSMAERARSHGVDEVLYKPFNQGDLLATLGRLLDWPVSEEALPGDPTTSDELEGPCSTEEFNILASELQRLSPEMRELLLEAAHNFDYGALKALASRLKGDFPFLAQLASRCAKTFFYQPLIDALS